MDARRTHTGWRAATLAVGAALAVMALATTGWAQDGADAPAAFDGPIASATDALWVIIAAVLVFLMQPGFMAFEVGFVRPKNTMVTAFKNAGDWLIVSVMFVLVGFGLMFGPTISGVVGSGLMPASFPFEADPWFWAFVLFQLAFAGTAATIVSGAMAERTSFLAYLVVSIGIGALIYPVFGHWAWGGFYFAEDAGGWLYRMGFIDFAGSSVVHGTGAWAALAGVIIVGPRLGRYDRDGRRAELGTNSVMWSCLGLFLLWAGWFGFNGGSVLAFDASVPLIVLNTNVAAGIAGIVGVIHCLTMQRGRDLEAKVLGCVLGGLVAITACAHIVTLWSALAIGAIAAVVHNVTYELVLDRWKLDDVVGAVPVHGFCGVWGILAVALFGTDLPHGRLEQLGVQALGAATNVVWAGGVAALLFLTLRAFASLRVPGMSEIRGLTLSGIVRPDDSSLDANADELLAAIEAEAELHEQEELARAGLTFRR